MKFINLIVFTGALTIMTHSAEAQGEVYNKYTEAVSIHTAIPHPKYKKTISFSQDKDFLVKKLSFSPDGRFLAVLCNPTFATGTLIIWDLQNNREQTRITGLPPSYGISYSIEILWGAGSKYIFFGCGRQALLWDPITGRELKDVKISASYAKLNRDRSKLMTFNRGADLGTFRVYDTQTWEFREFGNDGLGIETINWTADDRLVIAGAWPKRSEGRTLDGLTPKMLDSIVRLIDPSGKLASRSVLVAPSIPSETTNHKYLPAFSARSSIVDYSGNKVALGSGQIKVLDISTFKTLFTYAPSHEDLNSGKMAIGDEGAFTPDGQYLLLMGGRDRFSGKASSLIIDAKTGMPVATFPGGRRGFALSPDGRQMAIGNGQSVEFYDLH
jgi:WD40 repeat protein